MNESITGEQSEALLLLVAALEAVGVDYMLTGSVAAGFYGSARMSNDLDVVIDVPAMRRPLVKVLHEDFEADPENVEAALREPRIFNVFHPATLAKIDLIPRNQVKDSPEVFARRRLVSFGDAQVQIISPEDLVIAKLTWAKESRSEMQFRDVAGLLRREDLEMEYIRRKAAKFGLIATLNEIRDARYD
jgi:hypothetical protein